MKWKKAKKIRKTCKETVYCCQCKYQEKCNKKYFKITSIFPALWHKKDFKKEKNVIVMTASEDIKANSFLYLDTNGKCSNIKENEYDVLGIVKESINSETIKVNSKEKIKKVVSFYTGTPEMFLDLTGDKIIYADIKDKIVYLEIEK